ncbi:MAG: SPOR domain-containing protein [Desulfovibrio sp.]|uniref:SPOR domain-containing protein n=1 Tax=Desulfovibrio sp. TaxID=885 RepID=UPI00135E9EC0|nr:SPOR domain-containing protein [Desulfovibrio sp.]MTJ91263.1 SPOR domain-containing protein [Desulfovibrio sp.]
MAAPLRKPRKSAASQPSSEKRRFVIRLSGPMAALLGTILAVAVGWSFFMGFMVGRGQNPETRVEQMTSIISNDAPQAKGKAAQQEAPAPDAAATAETADGQNPAPTGENAAGAAPQQGAAGKPADPKGQKAAGQAPPTQQAQQGQQAPAYPFSQPSPNSMAAWGIKPGANQQAAQAGAQNGAQAPKPALAKTGPQFDYVYQVAAFKSDEDADKLRTRLEGKGLRTRTQKSGKLVLVMVSIRGTEDDAFNLREDLRHMKLGVPIMVSQKPVSTKPQKAGR